MARGRKLEVQILGDVSGLKRALGQGGTATAKFGKQTESVHLRMRKSFAGLTASAYKMSAGVVGAYASIEGAKKAIDATQELAETTVKLHRVLGLNVKQASAWGAVAKVHGIDTKALGMAFGTLSKNAYAAQDGITKQKKALADLGSTQKDHVKAQAIIAKGAGTQADAFKRLGVTTADLKSGGHNLQGLLDKLDTGFQKLPGGTNKAALAMKLFGRGWQTIVPLLRSGDEGMKAQLKTAEQMGATFKGKSVKSLEEFKLAQEKAQYATLGLQLAFGQYLAPALTKGITAVTKFVQQIRNGTGAGGRFADKMKDIWGKLQPVLGVLKDIGTFLAHQPRLLALAGAAFVTWKTLAAAQATLAKAKLIATFLGLGPKAAAGGAIAGAEFGTAASTATGAKMRGFNWGGLGRFAGPLFALGFVAAAQPIINDITGGGLSGNDVITPTKQSIFDLHGKINSNPGKGTQFPKLKKKPIGTRKPRSGPVAGASSVDNSPDDTTTASVRSAAGTARAVTAPIHKAAMTIGQAVVSGLTSGLTSGAGAVSNAAYKGLLYPVEAQIAKLQAQRDKLQALFDKQDNTAEGKRLRAALTHAGNEPLFTRTSSGGSSGGRTLAVKAGGHFLQGMGLQVGESKYFGGVTTNRHKHYPNDHYSGNSIDINAAGGGPAELSTLKAALAKLRAKFSKQIQFTLLEDVGTANQHLHVTFKNARASGAASTVGSKIKAGLEKVSLRATGTLTPNQIRGLAYAAGFRGHDLDVAVAIAMAESRGRVNASNRNSNGSIDRGLFQINSSHGSQSTFNVGKNAAAAFSIYKAAGNRFTDWTTFKSGAFRSFLGHTGSGSGASTGGMGFKVNTGRAGDIKSATKDLRDFIREQGRAKKLAAIDIKIKGLERLKAWKDAIASVADQIKGQLGDAVDSFQQKWENSTGAQFDADTEAMIANGPAAQHLKTLQDAADKISADAEDASEKQALEDAKRSGDPRAIAQAQAAIDETARQREITAAEKAAEDERTQIEKDRNQERKDRLDTDTANFKDALQKQLDAEYDQLVRRKENYATFVKDVQAIFAGSGVPMPMATDADTEAAINAGPGALGKPITTLVSNSGTLGGGGYQAPSSGAFGHYGHASGGGMQFGRVYRVGELGPENIEYGPSGPRVVPASRSMAASSHGGVVQNFNGPVSIGSQRAALALADRMAMRARRG